MSKHQKIRTITGGIIPCTIIGMRQGFNLFRPVPFDLGVQCPNHGDQSTIEAFTLTVGLWSVRGSSQLLNLSQSTQFLNEIALKIMTLIRWNLFREIMKNLSQRVLAMRDKTCEGVTNACVNYVKWSMTIGIFTSLSIFGASIVKKSIWNSSNV